MINKQNRMSSRLMSMLICFLFILNMLHHDLYDSWLKTK
ncbi:hypothetical protein CHCC14809_4074 [Bacillus licheniformis]|nr:hypothetical protein CHCC20341_3764 [Bacillus licheniformis]TWL35282.1 hypothetical protein CHCC15543_0028 [Bacillus licheniformis]TWL88007.1 hypothetical protein CHCC15292_0729 [Bacillus licheniformis]TWM67045.1 hypothetical protein CHCC14810_0536 [Bacillus licheniformis]TWM75672.1 hypothetical protein CHCC14809_4074 [Bacillus licheniformis]